MDERSVVTCSSACSSEVIAFYDKYAKTWDDRFRDLQSTRELHRMRVESFLQLAHLQGTDSLVELGVGTGHYLKIIAPLVRRVTCIDGSGEMLKVLRSRHADMPNIVTMQIDLEDPEYGFDVTGDVVYCFALLEHILDTESFVQNVKRMLKPSGRLVVSGANGGSPWYRVRRFWGIGDHCTSDRLHSESELDTMMISNGFRKTGAVYWGWCPPGVGDFQLRILKGIGSVIEKTWLRKWAGGLTVSYTIGE